MACPDHSARARIRGWRVDAIGAAALERHFEECLQCRALREELEHMRIAIRQDVRSLLAPATLRTRIAQCAGTRNRRGPRQAAAGGTAHRMEIALELVCLARVCRRCRGRGHRVADRRALAQ